ncbi:MAG: ADP-ribosylglycohydrolase family protein [Elusimicrobiota bacterium]|jgi:ADP-ribosylglycohydrolase
MLGAIAGDIIGSIYENFHTKRKDFALFTPVSFFTDDTVLTAAVADAILAGRPYGEAIRSYALRHPFRGYGGRFMKWMLLPWAKPYNSFGNGSAMRVSPVGWAFKTEDEVLEQAKLSAECTHNHPEGVKGAQAVALAVWLARNRAGKEAIRKAVTERFSYDLSARLDDIRPAYRTDITCQGSVPEAIIAFLESVDFEDAVRNAVSLGGDADTQAAIAGSIAEAHYGGVPAPILAEVRKRVSAKILDVVDRFRERFCLSR